MGKVRVLLITCAIMETRSVRTQIYLGLSLHILGAAQPSGNFDDTWSRFGRSKNDPSITSSWRRGFCALHPHLIDKIQIRRPIDRDTCRSKQIMIEEIHVDLTEHDQNQQNLKNVYPDRNV